MYNEKQLEAITTTSLNNVLVLAGAGCGKTSVLVGKVEQLLESGIPLNRLLIVTFTKKAANELKERLSKKITLENDWIGTFHSISRRLIIEYGELTNIKTLEKRTDIEKILNDLSGAEIDKNVFTVNESLLLKYEIPKDKDNITYKYKEFCKRNSVMCFNLMMIFSYEYLLHDLAFRKHIADNFDYILVDEFQDTSKLQYNWLKLLDTPIFAVGDDDQSIYGFRHAKVENLQTFLNERNAILIKLEQNYRCPIDIIEASNNVISENVSRLGKNLFSNSESRGNIMQLACQDAKHEALSIIHHIKQLLDSGVNPEEIVVLYRSNSQASPFEELCIENDINYIVKGAEGVYEFHIDFFKRAEIKLITAYLKLLEGDFSDFKYCINTPPRKIGEVTIEKIYKYAEEHNVNLLEATDKVVGSKNPFVMQIKKIMNLPKLHIRVDHLVHSFNLIEYFKPNGKLDRVRVFRNSLKNKKSIHDIKYTDPNAPKILLSTVHGVKGLEYDYVFITGMEEMTFPSYQSIQINDIEEERRLFYVALTRAKKKVFISYAGKRKFSNSKSRFLEEL